MLVLNLGSRLKLLHFSLKLLLLLLIVDSHLLGTCNTLDGRVVHLRVLLWPLRGRLVRMVLLVILESLLDSQVSGSLHVMSTDITSGLVLMG